MTAGVIGCAGEEITMPLRDHFRPPLSNTLSWEELHGGWPMVIVQQLRKLLPPGYVAGPKVHAGSQVEIDVATFEKDRDLFGRDHRYLNVFPSIKSMARAHDKVRDLTGPKRCFVSIRQVIDELNRWTKGWSGYFRYGYPSHGFRNLNSFMLLRLTRHLQRRSQRAYRTPAGESVYFHLQSLGLRFLK